MLTYEVNNSLVGASSGDLSLVGGVVVLVVVAAVVVFAGYKWFFSDKTKAAIDERVDALEKKVMDVTKKD